MNSSGQNNLQQVGGGVQTGNPQTLGTSNLQQPGQDGLQGAGSTLDILSAPQTKLQVETSRVKAATTQAKQQAAPAVQSQSPPWLLYGAIALVVIVFMAGLTYSLFRERSYERY